MWSFTCQCERPHRVLILSIPYSRARALIISLSLRPNHGPTCVTLGHVQFYTEFRAS
jgi:hypothetical protein